MPNLGDRVRGRDIGRKNNASLWFVWRECPKCKRQYWKNEYWLARSTTGGLCIHCAPNHKKGVTSNNWKGGRNKSRGYILILIYPDSPFYSMANSLGYIPEHRLIMAQHLGKCLKKNELVHHLNGIRDDNRKENLALVSTHNHQHNTLRGLLQKRIRDLEQLHLNL